MKSGFLENLRTRIGGQRKKWGGKKRADSPDTETQKMKSEAAKMPQAYARRDHTEVQKIKGESSDLAAEETGKTEKVGKKATEGNQTVLSEISKGESKAEMEEKKSTDFFGGDMEEEQDVLFEDGELADPEPEAPTEEAEFEVGRAEEKQPPEIEVTEIKSEETETAEPEPEETETAEPEPEGTEKTEPEPEETETAEPEPEGTEKTETESKENEMTGTKPEENEKTEPEPGKTERTEMRLGETEKTAQKPEGTEKTETESEGNEMTETESKEKSEEAPKETLGERPMLYENRELSWLKFNERVLEEAVNPRNPLCEKMSFLSIFQSNLDEFFMVRVGSLQDQGLLSQEIRDNKTNMTCEEQIDAILARVRELSIRKDEIYANIMAEVAEHGISLRSFRDLPKSKDKTLESYFMKEISPLLTAMLVGRKQPFPFLRSQEIYALAVLETKNEKKKLGIIPCTSHVFPRLIPVSSKPGVYMLSEELILRYIHKMYKGYRVIGKTLIRITRNADIDTDTVYDEDLGYRDYMAQIVKQRRKLAPIRLELTDEVEPGALATVCQYFELDESRVFFSKAPLDLSFLSQISGELRQDTSLVYPRRKPQPPRMVDAGRSMIAQILEKDILLTYPFESIRPFLNLLNEAARDPKVISIRMTLYRLAKNSKVIEALVEAVENGKQVDVLVELKARFDEENNIGWSRTLEDAGCHVVYGIDGLKVHSKLCLITRKDGPEIQYITQIGTGNYNESTAKVYTDLSLMTASSEIGEEASQIFHAILLGEVTEESEHLLVAPLCMKNRILAMMEEEIRLAKAGKPAYIGVKINSLTDKKIIDKLIDASRVGVKIDMVVRGICCLKSGIPGWTDNIRVMSIVGRFLEHSRIYIFGTPDRDRMYISSADFMTRNMLRRVEIAAPIYDEALKERLRTMFNTMLHDTVNGRIQRPDGTYVHCEPAENEYPVNSQEQFYTEAYVAAEHRQ